jgi:hypothetical protein
MRSLTWALKQLNPVGLNRQSDIRNRTPSNLKLHNRSKNPRNFFCWQEDGPPLANGVLCLITIVNPPLHLSHWDNIKDTTNTDTSTLYLDLHLKIDSERRSRTKLYDIRDDFNFPIVNFSFICSNIPATPAYGLYISQLTLYCTECASYQDFIDRELTRKRLNQRFLLAKLKSSLRKFHGRHHDLVNRYIQSVIKWPRICSTCHQRFPWVGR